MAVIFRPVTDKDLDYVYALEEIEQIKPFLGGSREWCPSVERNCHMAVDEKTGSFIMNLPQLDRMDANHRYLLVCNGKIILSDGGGGETYPIQYISPSLLPRLEELTPFLREAFANGGKYLIGGKRNDLDRALGEQKRFVLLNKRGA